MNKHGIRLITAVVTSSMIVTPVLAAPSVDDLKKEKAAKQSEVSSLQSQLTTLMGKVNTFRPVRTLQKHRAIWKLRRKRKKNSMQQ